MTYDEEMKISKEFYDEEMKISKEFYDTIDFTKFMSDDKQINIRDLMICIEEYYDLNHPDLIPEVLNGCFFNFMSEEEFTDYLCERYGWKKRIEYIENYYVLRNEKRNKLPQGFDHALCWVESEG